MIARSKSKPSNGLALPDDRASELADMFRMMGDPSRLKIIIACLDEPVTVGALAQRFGLSSSLVSHHLRLLRAARLLRAERRGKNVFYGAADKHIRSVIADMVAHVGEPAHADDEV